MMISSIRSTVWLGFAAVLVFAASCGRDAASPAAPSAARALPGLAAQGGSPGSPFGTNAIELTEVAGSTPAGGRGKVNVIPTGVPGFNNFEFTVIVHGGPAAADLYFQLRGDTGLTGGQQADGVCQRATTWPAPPASLANQVLHTSPTGMGVLHVSLETTSPFFDPGVMSDFMYRVVDFDQTFELRSACVQFTGQ
jgi:hypothetical protein